MKTAPLADNEAQRLAALYSYKILDTEAEACYDELVEIASYICETPIALVSLVDSNRQWFKAKVGLDAAETSRDIAFCSHAILQKDVFEVSDTAKDSRFSDNPLVTGAPDIKFYAGVPLITSEGMALGTLCVIDREPKIISISQKKALQALANQVVSQFELREKTFRLTKINEDKDKFFAMMSHDLRSPFQSILGFAGRLKNHIHKMSKEDIVLSADRIHCAADQTFNMMNNLLDLSKFQLGGFEFLPQMHHLHLLVDTIIDTLADVAKDKGITLRNQILPTEMLYADQTMFVSTLYNLMNNSLKFTVRGGEVVVSAEHTAEHTIVCVSDTGEGMSADKINALFEDTSFFTSYGTNGEKGTGLGILLCKSFVAKHAGKIWVESQEGKGSKFYIQFPSQT